MADNDLLNRLDALNRRAYALRKELGETEANIRLLQNQIRTQVPMASKIYNKPDRVAPPGIRAVTAKGRTYYYDRRIGERVTPPTSGDQFGKPVKRLPGL